MKTVVLYPGLAVSHFTPMMELAGVFLDHGYAVAVALINPSIKQDDAAFTAAVGRAISTKTSNFSFHILPQITNPPSLAFDDGDFFANYFDVTRRNNDHLHDFLLSIQPSRLHAVVVDTSCGFAIEAVRKLGSAAVPVYQFYPSDAGALAVRLQIPSIRGRRVGEGSDPVVFLGVPPLPACHVTDLHGRSVIEVDDELEGMMVAGARIMAEFDGIVINTCVSMEGRSLRALADPRCCPDGVVFPPVYAVGPLVNGEGTVAVDQTSSSVRHECLVWLDGQPDCSVVFLCFGSIAGVDGRVGGTHVERQVREIAGGLEKSGHRFMWVVRDAVLPEGFLERTIDRGLVVNGWVPQSSVLRHHATGAFVTHCGWNSALEGVTAGVPMLCWPMYAEQRINKVIVAEEMGVGVEMEGWLDGLVTAEEVESKVRLVMESEHGRKLRERVEAHQEAAAMAWKDDGSSHAAFAKLLSDIDKAHGKSSS
uniref:Glycosyltransferase n=1 Tax=Leersia perrieri TaxID=77586 RepID=A0A0D9XEZ5_9ORYZ